MQRLRISPLIVIATLALFVGGGLLWRFTHVRAMVIVGSGLGLVFVCRLFRAFVEPIANNRQLRCGKILLAVPTAFFSVAAFLAAWPVTFDYSPWVFAAGVVFLFGITRRYLKKLQSQVATGGEDQSSVQDGIQH